MWELKSLSDSQIQQCLNTVSSNTLLFIIGDALVSKKNLSIVRMADGEHILMDWCRNNNSNDIVKPTKQLDENWIEKFGITGITYGELAARLYYAAEKCTYFAASLSGIIMNNYNVYDFSKREKYVDNFYTYGWSEEYKIGLYKKAGHVLFIHNSNANFLTLKKRANDFFGVNVSYIKMSNWADAESVIQQANEIDAPLTIFSAGPAGKIIGPRISKEGNIPKVTLDIGSGMNRWLLPELQSMVDVQLRMQKTLSLSL